MPEVAGRQIRRGLPVC